MDLSHRNPRGFLSSQSSWISLFATLVDFSLRNPRGFVSSQSSWICIVAILVVMSRRNSRGFVPSRLSWICFFAMLVDLSLRNHGIWGDGRLSTSNFTLITCWHLICAMWAILAPSIFLGLPVGLSILRCPNGGLMIRYISGARKGTETIKADSVTKGDTMFLFRNFAENPSYTLRAWLRYL